MLSCSSRLIIIGICCFTAKHMALFSKSENWLAWMCNEISTFSQLLELGEMSSLYFLCGLEMDKKVFVLFVRK